MAKANSFKSQPWTALERGTYSVFDDDFISQKLTFKFTRKSPSSTVAFKDAFSIGRDGKVSKSDQQLKFWFPVNNRTLYFRLKNDSYKLHIDNGVFDQNGYRLNLYGSVQGKRGFGAENYKVGLQVAQSEWNTNLRAAYKPAELGVTLYNKTSFFRNKWTLGLVNAFQANANNWTHSALQVGWQDSNGSDYYLRASAGKKFEKINPLNYITDLTANYIYNYTPKTRFGFQVKGNLGTQELTSAAAVWDHLCAEQANTGIKVKADLNRNIAVAIKNNIAGYGSYLFGVNVSDFGGANRFSYGIQLDLNL